MVVNVAEWIGAKRVQVGWLAVFALCAACGKSASDSPTADATSGGRSAGGTTATGATSGSSSTGSTSSSGAAGNAATGGASGAGPTSIDGSAFADAYAAAVCPGIAACCARMGATPSADCASSARKSAQFLLDTAPPEPFLASTPFSPEMAARCVNQTAAAVGRCDPDLEVRAWKTCSRIYSGHQLEGQTCQSDRNCDANPAEDPLICRIGGVCEHESAWTPLKPGESCAGSARTCAGAFWCDPASGICGGEQVEGGPCGGTCLPGLACNDVTSRCQAAITSGGCFMGSECDGRTTYCDDCTVSCQPKKPDGAACLEDRECAGGACYATGCSRPLLGASNTSLGACIPEFPTPQPRTCPVDAAPDPSFVWEEYDVPVSGFTLGWNPGAAALGLPAIGTWADEPSIEKIELPPDVIPIDSVAGRSARDLFLAGNGVLYHGSGSADGWTPLAPFDGSTSLSPRATFVYVAPNGDLYVAGYNSTDSNQIVWRANSDGEWTDLEFFMQISVIRSMWLSPSGDFFAAGGPDVYRLRDNAWEMLWRLPLDVQRISGHEERLYLGTSHGLVKAEPGGTPTKLPLLMRPKDTINDLIVFADGTVVTVSPSSGGVFLGDGDQKWLKIGQFFSPYFVWAASPDEVYVSTGRTIARGRRRQ